MSNRNFDSSSLTKRREDKFIAQNVSTYIQSNGTIIYNPQLTDTTRRYVREFQGGGQTTYEQNLSGTYIVDPGVNLYSTPSITPSGPKVPGAPTNVVAVGGNGEATISFDAPINDGGSPITLYSVTSNPGGIVVEGVSSPITITGLTNGTAYTFTVKAINAKGPSIASSPSNSVTPSTIPDAPVLTGVTRGNGELTITFTQNDGGSPITNYYYAIKTGGPVWPDFVAFSPPVTSSPVIITGLTNGTQYYVKLIAQNANGNSEESNILSGTPATVPGAPDLTGITPGDGELIIQFIEGSNGGSSISNYKYSTNSGSGWSVFTAFDPADNQSPVYVPNLTNEVLYSVKLLAINDVGDGAESDVLTGTPEIVANPNPPTSVRAIPGNTTAEVSFTPPIYTGSSAIVSYTVTSSTGGFTGTGSSSPITVSGLSNGTTYTFNVIATNSTGSSVPVTSNSIVAGSPTAPEITSTSKTNNTITVNFTPPSSTNGSAITNYKYSLNGGSYTALSPADTTSPITITGLTPATTYTISILAVNANGNGLTSNQVTVTTYTTMVVVPFTSSSTWTAPADVTQIEYLIVGGGGGGGASYSDIEEIGAVPFQSTSPGPTSYWINNVAGSFYGYLYKGSSRYTTTKPARIIAPENITPNGAVYPYRKWYAFEMIYTVSSGSPFCTNTTYAQPQGMPTSTYSNNVSGGGGGGGGGYIQTSSISPYPTYVVTPGTTYTITVGAGGAGGVGGSGTETSGADGESSSFDTIVASGGAGGKYSRTGFNQNGGGGNYGGNEIMGGKGGAGGGRNGGAVINSEGYQWNVTYLRGTYGGSGAYINFDGNGGVIYGTGGDGGATNTIASGTTANNIGKGGIGTGATLNSYANGIAGGSGIVMVKYYI